MPGLDRTGPEGQGAQTGRKQGQCNPENEITTKEFPRRRGFGRGFRNRFENEQDFQGGRKKGPGRGPGRGLGRGRK